MKKNKLFILGLVTVFVALVSLTLVSSTWAKYTTTTTGTDSARVAYWGFKQASEYTLDLFDNNYTDVVANDSANVVAPGTTKFQTITFESDQTTAPEVDYSITYAVTASCGTELDANPNFVWKLKVGDAAEVEYQTIAELEAAIEALSVAEVNAGQKYTQTFIVGWEWKFADANSDKDTALGNATGALEQTSITITMTATQLND